MAGSEWSRRHFLRAAALVAAVPLCTPRQAGAAQASPPVCVFSKHLQFLSIPDLAKTVPGLGLDGVDLTVREGGHVDPKTVADDLPRAVDAIRAAGGAVPMITSNLRNGADKDAEPILKAAAKTGVRFCRIGGHQYTETSNPGDQVKVFAEELRSLTRIAEDNGVILGYHNHSGMDNFAGALWDLDRACEIVGSKFLGSNFDVGHAMVEGGYGGWRTSTLLMAPRIRMMAVKDFVRSNKSDAPQWTPLGEGCVHLVDILKIVRAVGFDGPISIHLEYRTASHGALLEDIGKAAVVLRKALKTAGYA